ncbi:nucleotidyltransferase domain-containing protein [Paenibacillus segetis]|uniref:Streptomycin adenylyltransferase n=1 Tax=Paenibacillus segetis TaxID=1325360 RepID=A0ABQ1YIY2_9BACL|nr:nucleotidyltransferase domain-containing protein [Paenibacillus segetis]GGH27032.1 hypothetical protein GCM10008013_28230 [Paenibacillus segetis]
MKQLEAVNTMLDVIKNDSAVRAIFLKGSIARNDLDDYSDVDFYCIVKEDQIESFLERRLDYLQQYKPLIYWSESNFVGPQIVAVFNNGLHFDLYTVTFDSLHHTDEIKVLYDPEQLLQDYTPENLTINKDGVIRCFHEFTFSLLEFEAAYCRNDILWASRLASHLSGDISIILRYLYDEENARVGFKRLHKSLDERLYKKMVEAMDYCGPSYLPKGVQLLTEIADEIMDKLPDEISNKLNKAFFYYMVEKINRLKYNGNSKK